MPRKIARANASSATAKILSEGRKKAAAMSAHGIMKIASPEAAPNAFALTTTLTRPVAGEARDPKPAIVARLQGSPGKTELKETSARWERYAGSPRNTRIADKRAGSRQPEAQSCCSLRRADRCSPRRRRTGKACRATAPREDASSRAQAVVADAPFLSIGVSEQPAVARKNRRQRRRHDLRLRRRPRPRIGRSRCRTVAPSCPATFAVLR